MGYYSLALAITNAIASVSHVSTLCPFFCLNCLDYSLFFLESGGFLTLEVCSLERGIVQFAWGLKIVFHGEQYYELLICVILDLFKHL